MNKIQRVLLTTISLLVTMGVLADSYSITIDNAAPASGTISLTSEGTTTSGTSASGATVKLYASPTGSYYLEKIVVEYVMDLDDAESREISNRAQIEIDLGQKIIISKETEPQQFENNKANRYGGTYTFQMPTSNVFITATFQSATSFTGNGDITLEISGSNTYTGLERQLVVTNTLPDPDVTLVEGTDFRISSQQIDVGSGFEDAAAIKNAGTYQFTIQGLGAYSGEKTISTLTINKANLRITPKDKSRQYRDANPTYSNTSSTSGDFTYSGFVNGETNTVLLANQPSATIGADINSSVGSYTVTASGATATNYNIIYNTGTLTITQRDVTSTATSTLAATSYNYDNNPHQPAVTVIDTSDGNKGLTLGTDFTVTYVTTGEYGNTDFISPDIYYVKVNFTGNYTGTQQNLEFQIRRQLTLDEKNKWYTFFETDINMRVPDGFEAYVVNSISSSVVGIQQKSFIKKNVPMLLYRTGDVASLYPELVKNDEGGLDGISKFSSSDGSFEGVDALTDVTNLATPNYDLWILVNGEFVRTKSGELPAHKCYLKLKSSLFSAPSLSLSRGLDLDDETTNVSEEVKVNSEKFATADWYDLSGRRIGQWSMINGQLKPGLYIVNGKKIVIK